MLPCARRWQADGLLATAKQVLLGGLSDKESFEAQELARAGQEKLEAGIKALREAGELSEASMQKLMRDGLRGGLDPKQIEEAVKRSAGPRSKAEPAPPSTHLYALDSLQILKLDPAECARGLFVEEREARVEAAYKVIEWLEVFIAEVEGRDEHKQSQAA